MNIPKELKYSNDHEWVRLEGDTAVVGISDYAQSQLGDAVFVELPEEDIEVSAKQGFAVIESVKAVSDIYAPVAGKVIKVNEALADAPELINQDPYGEGWIAVIQMTDKKELDELLDSTAYEKLIAEGGE
ncbi:MAG: glycine cleavage system protein GcvH [Veillonellales bacterium]